ncbi:regulator of G-protein signaling 20 isoform X1 [Vulpes vulpes]|uniref:Regulator of G-protein signaling 20 isoform X1 n=2 Tax=Vulpes vulpes TaxID=9627 RepID=A0ABM4YKL2_VULVU
MPSLPQDNQVCLQEHFSRPSVWKQFLPLRRAEGYKANIHQTMESEGSTNVVHDIKLPDSPAAPTPLGLLSSSLSGLARVFSHLLRRPPSGTPQRRPDSSLLLAVRCLPAAGLPRGHGERPGRLSLLLGAALALPSPPPGGRAPREEDACAGQSSPMPPMGSERPEMRTRQMPAAPKTAGSTPGPPGAGGRGANACCFCWCCCCSCSCPSPTLEEVNAWSQSFDKVMLTPAGRNAFREFLRTEFSEENMLFWMACEELKKEANKTIIEEKARTIYEDYISILSPKEVSLDSRVREVINRNMVEPSQHIFDDAQLQIYTLMHRDSYPRFMNSALYKDLLQSLSEKSAEA